MEENQTIPVKEQKLYKIGSIVGSAAAEYAVENDIFKKSFDLKKLPATEQRALKKILANSKNTARSKQWQDDSPVSIYSAADCIEPVYNQEYLAKLYDMDPHHAAAVDALVDNIVGLGHYLAFSRKTEKVRIRTAKERPEKKEKLDEKLEDLKSEINEALDEFNQIDTFEEILDKVARDRFTMGNGYLEIGRTLSGEIGYIGHIPAHTMRIRRLRDGFVQYVGNKPIFFRNFGDKSTANPFSNDTPNEIIHFKRYSPVDTYYGVPEIASAIDAIAGNKFASRYNVEYFENKAVPRYVVKVRGVDLSLPQKKELLKLFETNTKGQSHRTIVIPLPPNKEADIEFEAIETKVQEASFVNYTKANIQAILARHRVPQNRLGIPAEGSNASSKDADKIFKESVCRPQQRIFEKLVGKIFKELTVAFVFKLNEYTLTDEDQQSIIDERYLKTGVYVPDEVRSENGLPPRPDGKGNEPLDVRSVQEDALDAAAEQAEVAAKTQAAQMKAEQKADGNRQRDSVRSANRSQAAGAPASRNAAGEGKKKD